MVGAPVSTPSLAPAPALASVPVPLASALAASAAGSCSGGASGEWSGRGANNGLDGGTWRVLLGVGSVSDATVRRRTRGGVSSSALSMESRQIVVNPVGSEFDSKVRAAPEAIALRSHCIARTSFRSHHPGPTKVGPYMYMYTHHVHVRTVYMYMI